MGSDGDVKFVFTSDIQKVLQDLHKSNAALDRKVANLRKVNRAGQDAKKSVGGIALAIGSGLASWSLLTKAIQAVNREIQTQIDLQDQAARGQVTLASARNDVIRNLGAVAPGVVTGVLANVTDIARRTRVEEKYIAKGMASALSASSANVEASTAAVERAALFLVDRPTEIPTFAGALLDISKVTGTIDARLNQGFLSILGSLSRIVSAEQQARNVPSALIGQLPYGAKPQTAAALYATLTTEGADPIGAMSATAAVSLAEQLAEFLPDEPTMAARIAKLQARPGLARQFFDQASFEKRMKGPIRQLLIDATSQAARTYAANLQAFPSYEEMGDQADIILSNFLADPLETIARLDRAYKSTENQMLLTDLIGAKGGITRTGLRNVLKASGVGALGTSARLWGFEAITGLGRDQATEEAIDILSRRQHELLHPVMVQERGPALPREPTDSELQRADLLREILAELRRVNTGTLVPSAPE